MTTVHHDQTTITLRPRYDGANIRTWVGFKHFQHLAEEAVLAWFRDNAAAPGVLYRRHGLGLEIVDSSVVLPAVLDVDDTVTATVTRQSTNGFSVRLRVHRGAREEVALRGKLTVALVEERDAPAHEPPPEGLAPLVVSAVGDLHDEPPDDFTAGSQQDVAAVLTPDGSATFRHSFRASYVYCHYSDRVQHSAYVRALEDVVDRFLHDRGLGIAQVLDERSWIPVVSRVRVTLLADAHMDEIVHTTFAVRDVLKETTFDAEMHCYVHRGTRLAPVATARILHGYAVSSGEHAGTLARLDPAVVARLLGGSR